jgi:hypothetical protein
MREYMFYFRREIRVENIAELSRDYFRDPITSNVFAGFLLLGFQNFFTQLNSDIIADMLHVERSK